MPESINPGTKARKLIGMDLSLESAEWISSIANWTLVLSLLVGVAATYAIVVSGSVKEAALKSDLATANESAAKSNERAAALEVRAAELQKQAEEAKLESEKIKAQTAWRTLSKEQFDIISNGLRGSDLEISLVFHAGDQEAIGYGLQIAEALKAAGLKVKTTNAMGFGGPARVGVMFSGTDPQLDIVKPVFEKASIELLPWQETDRGAEIEIGSKPAPSYE